jgi:golgi apparatus protein 1
VQGSARVIRCLQDHRDELSPGCRTTMFDHEVWTSESIDFNKPMKDACADEVAKLCGGVAGGEGDVLWCLREKAASSDVGKECKKVRACRARGREVLRA